MKLRNRRDSPPSGGFWFRASDGEMIRSSGNLDKLFREVEAYYQLNGIPIPHDLDQEIEDQICERLPATACFRGLGDRVAGAIQAGAALVDSVAGTNLVGTAKRCGGCGKRKRTLNRLVPS